MYRGRLSIVSVLAVVLTGCQTGRESTPAIGEAFVGPATLKIRSDIPLQAKVVATVKHGERLEILQQRRRFLRVRTESGAEGWTDERQLLAAEDMQKLKDLAARSTRMPVQGQGTTFNELNVHTQPSRQSPSFLQVKENEKFDVLLHTTAPRTETARKPLIPPPPPKKPKVEEKKAAKETKYPPLPMPKPPSPPANWLNLSKTDLPPDELEDENDPKEQKPAANPKAEVPLDDWSLIRTKGGESGWVLTRRISMAIPDDVAQYAEGRRIVSYFSLGSVEDGAEKKPTWLWTTIADGTYPYDFDSFRVFIWSLRRHRYETAYIDRNLRGYAPVLLHDVELPGPKGRSDAAPAHYPGFSICVEKKDGQRYRRNYAFLTNIVRFAGEQPCETGPLPQTLVAQTPLKITPPAQQPPESLSRRVKRRLHSLTKGWLGG